jgi:hypothetical protein
MNDLGPSWQRALSATRHSASSLERQSIPASPGVYIWFQGNGPVYIGEAKGKQGLRQRLGAHLATTVDLSRSTLRASVAVAQLGLSRKVARQRPTVVTESQVALVNEWLASCEIGWIECESAASAHTLESLLRAEWLPPLNRI